MRHTEPTTHDLARDVLQKCPWAREDGAGTGTTGMGSRKAPTCTDTYPSGFTTSKYFNRVPTYLKEVRRCADAGCWNASGTWVVGFCRSAPAGSASCGTNPGQDRRDAQGSHSQSKTCANVRIER